MGIVILILLVGGVIWFVGPFVHSYGNLKRREFEVRNLTRRTIRDMDKATKNDRRIW